MIVKGRPEIRGEAWGIFLKQSLFHVRETPFLSRESAKKGTSTKKCRGIHPQDLPLNISKAISNVGRARTATLDFAKYMYHRLGTYHDAYQFLFFILYM